MHNKLLIAGGVLAIFVMVLGFYYINTNVYSASNPSMKVDPVSMNVCTLFTPEEAQTILGTTVTKTDSATGNRIIGRVVVTHCSYTNGNEKVSVLIRKGSSLDEAKRIFTDSKKTLQGTSETEMENAYWVEKLGQYNILKDDMWIITSASGNKENAFKAATIVSNKL